MIVLPTQVTPKETGDPKFLVLFGNVKQGKSTICADLTLKTNAIVLDLKDEYFRLDAKKFPIKSLNDLNAFVEAVEAKNTEINKFFYDYIIIDNASYLEDILMPLAARLYKDSDLGKNWQGNNVLNIAMGGGYRFATDAFKKVINRFRNITKHLILVCHMKDIVMPKDGEELTVLSMDLLKQTAKDIGKDADALGLVYRKDNQTIINFNGIGNIIAQSRCDHIAGEEIVIAESDENKNITVYWDRVFREDKNLKLVALAA